MRRFLTFYFVLALLSSGSLFAQTKAKAQNVPEIPYESVPNFLKLPPGLYMGEAIGVSTTVVSTRIFFPRVTLRSMACSTIRENKPRSASPSRSCPRRTIVFASGTLSEIRQWCRDNDNELETLAARLAASGYYPQIHRKDDEWSCALWNNKMTAVPTGTVAPLGSASEYFRHLLPAAMS